MEEAEEAPPRAEPSLVPAEERVQSFVEAVHALSPAQARCEAARCLRCDIEH